MAQLVQMQLKNITEYPNSFERQGAFPLEKYSVFDDFAKAEAYAKDNLVSYVGQPLAVVFENKVVYYVIGKSGELIELGTFKDIEALDQRLGQEIERATKAELALHEEIAEEARAREAADNIVYDADGGIDDNDNPVAIGLLPDEIKRAKEAEAALNILIGKEVENREQAIKDLDESIKKTLEEENKARVEAEKQLAKAIDDERDRAIAEEQMLAESLNKETSKLDILIGNDGEKSVRRIANEELAAQLLSGKADADFKTLQELATWIENHPEDVTEINQNITENAENIAKEEKRATDKEQKLQEDIEAEATLRETQVNELSASLKEETQRATDAELGLADDLKSESQRALEAEEQFEKDLGEEIERATKAEANLTADLNKIYNPEGAEDEDGNKIPSGYLPTETAERVAADAALTELIEKEAERAKQVEDTHTHKVTYTPEGNIDVTLTVTPGTFTFNEADSIGSLPTFYAEYDDKVRNLTFKFGAGTLPSYKQKSITAVTDVSVATKTFTGTEQTVTSEPFKEVTTNE